MVNQILCHIGSTPVDVIKYCQEHDIVVEAYSPIAHGAALNNPQIKAMADKYGVKKMVLVSTDKAVRPTNVMGATKRFAETIIQY